MKKLSPILILLILAYIGWIRSNQSDESTGVTTQDSTSTFGERETGKQVEGSGTVIKILPDDNEGSRHQKFL